MGFFDEIKKVLFGAKAVTKSAAGKVVEKGKEAGENILDGSEELFESAKSKASDVGEKVMDTAGDVWEKAVDAAEDLGDVVKEKAGGAFQDLKEVAEDVGGDVLDKTGGVVDKVKDVAENIGETVMDKGGNIIDGARDLAENIGEKVLDKGADVVESAKSFVGDAKENVQDSSAVEKAAEFGNAARDKSAEALGAAGSAGQKIIDEGKDLAENIGERVLEAKADLIDKAKDLTGNLGEKLDETVAKAKEMAAEEAAKPEYKERSPLLEKELLEDKDDFFKKAEAFADGRYEEVTDPFSTKPKITRIEGEEKAPESSDPVPGFEDMDGDGDEIIDDAIIVEEE